MSSEVEAQIFECVSKPDLETLKQLFSKHKLSANIFDSDGMTPLQHASYKGYIDIVQFLLKTKADVNCTKHEHGYSALHFAALSGNSDLCLLLLKHGIKSNSLNSVNRTPAQLAAFVGNHNCATVINNFIPKSDVDYYTVIRGTETEPKLPPVLKDPLYNYLMMINIHPIRLALSIPKILLDDSTKVNKVMELMCDREIKRGSQKNEVIGFKIHYLRYIFCELKKCGLEKNTDPVEVFAKRILRGIRGEEYLEQLLRECVREFPFREGLLFQQMVNNLTKKETSSTALALIVSAINGQRNFLNEEDSPCVTCAEPKAIKKCSKCKVVQYCDRECQRLHWFMHKKSCARSPTVNNMTQETNEQAENVVVEASAVTANGNKSDLVTDDVDNQLKNVKVN